LYYHLDVLGDLIAQDERRKYMLTEKGKLALELLSSSDAQMLLVAAERPNLGGRVRDALLFSWLFMGVSEAPLKHLPGALAIVALGAWLSAQSRLGLTLLFFNPVAATSVAIAACFVLSWLAIFVLADVVSTLLFKRRGGDASLLIGVAYSISPLLISPLVTLVYSALGLSLSPQAASTLLLSLQAWTLCLLSVAVSLSKGLRIDRAALVVLVVMYANIAYFLPGLG
jgi:hypothetical protein